MNKKKYFMQEVLVVLFFCIVLSGCTETLFNFSTTYQSHPTQISYSIRYGYELNSTGTGNYQIKYDCNIPSVLAGSVSYQVLYEQDYELIRIGNNELFSWNISDSDETVYELGVQASVVAETFLITDLTGDHALTIPEIAKRYPDTSSNYLNGQSNGSTYLINPYDSSISSLASNIISLAQTNNSFLVAKELFIWLTTNTQYKIHDQDKGVQPPIVTLEKRTGDCDDLSFLYISLCRSVGIPARFVRGYLLSEDAAGVVTAVPHAWAQVFVGGFLGNNGWIAVECASATSDETISVHQNFGVESAHHLRLFVDDGSNESLLKSLSGISYSYDLNRHIDITSFIEIKEYNVIESEKLVIDSENKRTYQ
jgi:transglutaminase-like putative cysteine protease